VNQAIANSPDNEPEIKEIGAGMERIVAKK